MTQAAVQRWPRSSIGPNALPALRERIAAGRVGWTWPLIMAFIRLPLTLAGAAITYVFFAWQNHPQALSLTFAFANFYFTFVNVISLLLLVRLTRREGIRLLDLVGLQRDRIPRDSLLGLLWFVLLYLPFVIGVMLVPLLIYGADAFNHFQEIFAPPGDLSSALPGWLIWWGLIVFPLVNAPTEELHYRGYALPRLVALSGRPWLSMLVVALGFGLQHVTLAPSVLGAATYIVAFFLWGLGANVIYSWQRRLPSLMVAHYLSNVIAPLTLLVASVAGGQ